MINISLAAYPGERHVNAAIKAIESANAGSLVEPLWGRIHAHHVQLVPQNFGILDETTCQSLMDAFPKTQFRLHANVRVTGKHTIADISGLQKHREWFEQAARISKFLKAPAYSAHSGSRSESDIKQMLDNARKIADLFGVPVAIEGQYPVEGNTLLVTSWDEYRQVFESGLPYVIDLSHLNILAHKTGLQEMNLVKEMLNNGNCIEVHVSDNNGIGDWHQVCEKQTWWYELMPYINKNAVVFTEGNHLRGRK